MNQPLFTGVCTALVTPFWNGQVNYPMLGRLLQRQLDAGIRAVVLCGTTGEAATLSDEEKLEIIRFSKEFVGDSCLIIAGTGSNSTQHALALSRGAQQMGADALLVVTPYYNKATADGILAHYAALCQGVGLPVVAYNVPGRTGLDIPQTLYPQLAQLPHFAGVKEASGSIGKIARIRRLCPELPIWSGNDDQIAPVLSLGGLGVISVVSNVVPELTLGLTQAALDGDFDTAAALQLGLLPLIDCLFSQVNPIPVKAAMALSGFDCGPCRLPLTAMEEGELARLKGELDRLHRILP